MFSAILALAAASDARMVLTALQSTDLDCWMGKCGDEAEACAKADPLCSEHLECVGPDCFKGTSFLELGEAELKLFGCAAKHGCIAPEHPSVSFLEEALGSKGLFPTTGINMEDVVGAIEQKMLDEVDNVKKGMSVALGAKDALKAAAEKYVHLHAEAQKNPSPESFAQLAALDKDLAGLEEQMQNHLALQHERSKQASVSSLPAISMMLASVLPAEAQKKVTPDSLLEIAKMVEPAAPELSLGDTAPIDLMTTKAVGMNETLAEWIQGLGGDTDELMATAKKAAAADSQPLKADAASSFREGYMKASAALHLPATDTDAEKALASVQSGDYAPASLVEARKAKHEQTGSEMMAAEAAKLQSLDKQLSHDFPQAVAVDAQGNLREQGQ